MGVLPRSWPRFCQGLEYGGRFFLLLVRVNRDPRFRAVVVVTTFCLIDQLGHVHGLFAWSFAC